MLALLKARGYRVVGPTVRDQAIVYDDIASVDDLPAGWTDEQDGGRYRLLRRDGRCPLRLRRRAAFLEEISPSAGAAPVAARSARRRAYA